MDKSAALDAVSRFRTYLESKGISVQKLILFGSYYAGTHKEGSDIDVVVISDDFRDKDYWQRIDILSQAIYEVFEPIEAIAMTPDEWEKDGTTAAVYSKAGEVIYGA